MGPNVLRPLAGEREKLEGPDRGGKGHRSGEEAEPRGPGDPAGGADAGGSRPRRGAKSASELFKPPPAPRVVLCRPLIGRKGFLCFRAALAFVGLSLAVLTPDPSLDLFMRKCVRPDFTLERVRRQFPCDGSVAYLLNAYRQRNRSGSCLRGPKPMGGVGVIRARTGRCAGSGGECCRAGLPGHRVQGAEIERVVRDLREGFTEPGRLDLRGEGWLG